MENVYLKAQETPVRLHLKGNLNKGAVVSNPKGIEHATYAKIGEYQPNEFSDAIYGDGPYSLLHPNNRTELVAQNADMLA